MKTRNILLIIAVLLVSCGGEKAKLQSEVVFVSIAPLAYLVEQIATSSVVVEVLVPETTSPETYEPTTAQIQRLSSSRAYINTGLIDFETELNKSIMQMSDSIRLLDLSQGVEVLEGTCSHAEHAHDVHHHGVDPHTWLSPKLMRQFAIRIKVMLDDTYPASTDIHTAKLTDLLQRIDSLDNYIRSKGLSSFAIAHPSLTYFAADYGLNQIAIEVEGKEPAIAQMKDIIVRIRDAKLTKIFYQKQTSAAAAQTIAKEVGAQVIEFDPLAKDWITNMYFITDQIAK